MKRSRIHVVIPHLSKLPSALLPTGSDLSDPPLSAKSISEVPGLTDQLVAKFGPPAMIVHSPKQRAKQTAAAAIERFGQHYTENGVLVMSLSTLAQPESGDPAEKGDPRADAKGLIYYGARSSDADWYRWYLHSLMVIEAVAETITREGPIFQFTHRPFAAVARYVTKQGWRVPETDEVDALDKSLLPWVAVRMEFTTVGDPGKLVELATQPPAERSESAVAWRAQ